MVVETIGRKVLRYADETDDMGDFPLREGLDWRRRKEAEIYRAIARGTMLVTGERGSGKDLFAVTLTYLNKYYFGRRVLLDFLPKKAFGEYTLFNARVMMQEIHKMAKAGGVQGIEGSKDRGEFEEFIADATVKWALEGEGFLLFKDAVIYLSELKRYCPKRNPGNRFNKFVGSVNSVLRHLDALMVGTHVFENEIDRFTFVQYANIRAQCTWLLSIPDTTEVRITMTSIIGASAAYSGFSGKLRPLRINGKEPRGFLADKCFYDLWRSKSIDNLMPVGTKEMN